MYIIYIFIYIFTQKKDNVFRSLKTKLKKSLQDGIVSHAEKSPIDQKDLVTIPKNPDMS